MRAFYYNYSVRSSRVYVGCFGGPDSPQVSLYSLVLEYTKFYEHVSLEFVGVSVT